MSSFSIMAVAPQTTWPWKRKAGTSISRVVASVSTTRRLTMANCSGTATSRWLAGLSTTLRLTISYTAGTSISRVLAGLSMLWLQRLAMVLGIVMLSAIAYVTLSTGERPFQAINRHVNPVLGWGWALASLAANMVWSLPQFALATSVVQQNLAPGLFGNDGPLGETGSKLLIVALILALTVAVTFAYDRGTRGVQIYERLLKGLVALVVLCFFGVVARLSTSVDGLDWGAVLAGFVPDFGSMSEPTATFGPFLDAVSAEARAFWTTRIVAEQRDVMISAATLVPYRLPSTRPTGRSASTTPQAGSAGQASLGIPVRRTSSLAGTTSRVSCQS